MLNQLELLQANNTALEERFKDKLKINYYLNRQLVSFQANKNKPGYRWFRYKEGFSEALIQHLIDYLGISTGRLLDPFAGVGTTLFVAKERGVDSLGIELLPIGWEVIEARKIASTGNFSNLGEVLNVWHDSKPWCQHNASIPFPHLRITNGAFPEQNQRELEQYLAATQNEHPLVARLLRFAALCVLEEISYTRKDGQYLRWDYRSGRRQGTKPFDKGYIATFDEAITAKLDEIASDLSPQPFLPGFWNTDKPKGDIEVLHGSCLRMLPTLDTASFDALITSPPYCNRYDYTRTYALELAMLGVSEDEIRQLRQAMVSCTVENKEKTELRTIFPPETYSHACDAFETQHELHAILNYLEEQRAAKLLNNPGIPRMIRNYFFEMTLVIFECARVLKSGAPLAMVNDNVRYGGAVIPVDLILSDIAEKAGFDVESIWVLPTGKGNSSQQMGVHGRKELRKCIYIWRRK